MKHVLINCSNLYGGGGIAVATSYISSLSNNPLQFKVSLLLSSSLYTSLVSQRINFDLFFSVEVFDSSKNLLNILKLRNKLIGYDCVFTMFGPPYLYWKINSFHIVGFALPWVIYKNNNVPLPFFYKKLVIVKHLIKQYFFLFADCLIVELEHVKSKLESIYFLRKLDIKIIYSEVDQIFFDKSKWQSIKLPSKKNNTFYFGIISKNYPHKNISCITQVKNILKAKYSMNVEFFVTFDQNEWDDCPLIFKSEINNVGPLLLSQCPSFYDQLDGVVFPTLLECFSAVPIESLFMKVPLFASSYPFIYDCCNRYCQYFDPMDPNDIASVIYKYFQIPETERVFQLESAHRYIKYKFISGRRSEQFNMLISDFLNI